MAKKNKLYRLVGINKVTKKVADISESNNLNEIEELKRELSYLFSNEADITIKIYKLYGKEYSSMEE